MGIFVNPKSTAYRAALNSEIYVDKSDLIYYLNGILSSPDAFICNSRPRLFGKLVTASMLDAYYSKGADSKEIFSHLKIASLPGWDKHLNKYDVISLDVSFFIHVAGNPNKVVSLIQKRIIEELREYYPDYVRDDEKSLPDVLTHINRETKSQFVIIIYEWDILIRDYSKNKKALNAYISFLRDMFTREESASYIALAYLTGILPIMRENKASVLSNFKEYTMLHPCVFAPYFGFNEDEVKELCSRYRNDYDEVKRRYCGYHLKEWKVYNPMEISRILEMKSLNSYWTGTCSYEVISDLFDLNFPYLKEDILLLLSGKDVAVDTSTFQNDVVSFSSKHDVLTYLIHLGYLGYNEADGRAFIPNEEIRDEICYAIRGSTWEDVKSLIKESYTVTEATVMMDEVRVGAWMENTHNRISSFLKFDDESSFLSVLTYVYFSSMKDDYDHILEDNADVIFFPKPKSRNYCPLLLVEINKDSKSAVERIKKKYPSSLKEFRDNILLVDIKYDKKPEKYSCKIVKL